MNTWTNPATYAILIGLLLICIGYAFLVVRRIRNRDREHGQTAWLVAVGDGIVIVAVVAIIAANQGIDTAIQIGAICLAAFIIAGLPMAWEYVDDYLQQRQQQRIASRLQQLLEED